MAVYYTFKGCRNLYGLRHCMVSQKSPYITFTPWQQNVIRFSQHTEIGGQSSVALVSKMLRSVWCPYHALKKSKIQKNKLPVIW